MAMITGDFSITRGDTWTESWTLVDADGAAVDITGGKFYFTVKNDPDDEDPGVLQLTSPLNGITIDDAPAGKVTFEISATQSGNLDVQTYYYDVQYKDANGKVSTLAKGRMTVEFDITRSTD